MRSIFRPKDRSTRFQGIMTTAGHEKFEAARRRLAKMAHVAAASDADVVEALSRGWEATEAYLKAGQ